MEQTYEPMYKNRIRGIRCRANWQLTAKPISIKGTGCKFRRLRTEGDRAYLGRSVVCPGIRTEGGAIHSDRAAEVSSGRSSVDSLGNQEGAKAQTVLRKEGNGSGE